MVIEAVVGGAAALLTGGVGWSAGKLISHESRLVEQAGKISTLETLGEERHGELKQDLTEIKEAIKELARAKARR